MVNFQVINVDGIYNCDLGFNQATLDKMVKQIYELENDENKKFHSAGRTFQIKNGFHSCNILNPELGVMEKYKELNLLVSRIQEILFTEFNDSKLFCTFNSMGEIYIKELWINILRIEDYNNPHTHPNNHLSGNFYLKVPNDMDSTKGTKYSPGYNPGQLLWITQTNQNTCSFHPPTPIHSTKPTENKGVIFESHMPHQVLPHFSKDDRIGCAFNSVYKEDYSYDDLYPIPYWLPLKYDVEIKKENIISDSEYKIKFKNGIEIIIDKYNFVGNNGSILTIDKMDDFIDKKLLVNPFELQKHRNKSSIEKDYYFGKLFDDYFSSKEELWKKKDLHYYEDNKSDILLLIFSGKGGNNSGPTFIFHNFLKEYRMDKLFLRDLDFSWFLNNDKFFDEGNTNIDRVLNLIKNFIKPRHKKIFTIGASAGGYASILFGHLLDVSGCMAFAPQTLINKNKLLLLDDNRWEVWSSKVVQNVNDKYLDLNNHTPFKMKTNIFYTNDVDKKHCEYLNSHSKLNITYIESNDNSHLTAKIMRDNGMLKKELDKMIMNFDFEIF
jgi:uncharacterized protein (TIGR02466 family)